MADRDLQVGHAAEFQTLYKDVSSGAGTAYAEAVVPVDATGTPLATLTLGTPVSLGQADMAHSVPAVLASDQSPVPVTSTDTSRWEQSHDFTTTGAHTALDLSADAGLVYSLQVTADGTVTSFIVTLEGSLDGTNWGTAHPLLTFSSASLSLGDVASATAKPLKYVRANCTALTLNSATKITAHILALR